MSFQLTPKYSVGEWMVIVGGDYIGLWGVIKAVFPGTEPFSKTTYTVSIQNTQYVILYDITADEDDLQARGLI